MNRRKFLSFVGCSCGGFLLPSCTTAPITERKQLKIISEAKLNAQAASVYEKIKEKEKMSDDTKTLNEIKNIGKKMEDSISEYFDRENLDDPTKNFDWEYILIDKKKVRNAWCMPGGKIAVYTGILDATKNTNGLAAVMGHEIAHAVAKHSVERASRGTLLNVGTRIIDIASGGVLSDINRTTGQNTIGLLAQLGILNPFNRKQESEADYLGMIFASLSGYDIRETVKIWERMKELNKGKEPPEFLSTHPSSDNRIKDLNKKMRNAWCMPGGKIAVYTGILDATKNTNGLAAVMGHEIAHAVAKHSVERASRGVILNTSTQLIDIFSGGKLSQVNRATGMNTVGLLSQLGIMNPFNRKQESEADYLGMIFSSLSGYDIRETVKIWERMKEFNKGKAPPEFMSTHPSADNRIKKINEWTNEIILDYPPIKV